MTGPTKLLESTDFGMQINVVNPKNYSQTPYFTADATGAYINGVQITPGGGGGNIDTITQNLLVDPRNHGAKCTGFYGINASSIDHAGTNFAVGDTFIVADNALDALSRGGVPATGHVTSIGASGAVTGYVIDTPGSAYYTGACYVTPTSGAGLGFAITISSVYTPPSAPTTTLASGGVATAAWNGSYVPGGAYQVGDLFAVPNPGLTGNYIVCRVASVSNGQVVTYTVINYGGDYQIVNAVPTITLTGYGSGATINITSSTSSNNTFDDTYGYCAAAVAAVNAGGSVLVPDNSWVGTLMLPAGAVLTGQNIAPNYAYGDVPNNLTPSRNPHLFAISDPNFIIDLNNKANHGFQGFEVRAYVSGAYGATAAIGSFIGNGGGNGKTWVKNMSFKGCCTGFGTASGTGATIFAVSENCDYGACQYGRFGPLSDDVTINDTFVSGTSGLIYSTAAQGFHRVLNPRFEYLNDAGLIIDSGGSQCEVTNAQFDRIVNVGIRAAGANLVNVTGGSQKGCGLAGTLTVTGAANNGSGLVRLTVTGWGNNPNGGATATSGLVTGDIANVSGIVGTTEANGNQQTITVVDGSHIDLQGSSYVNAYISGGNIAVNGKSSYISLNTVTDFHCANVGFYGSSAGQALAAATVIDSTASSRISFLGGTANSGNGATGGYQQAFANWHNSGNTPPAHFIMEINGTPRFSNEGYTFNIPIGFINANNGTYLLDALASFPYTINNLNAVQTSTGTVTAEIAINGTAVTGLGNVSVTSTPANVAATVANSVAVGNAVSIVLSNASSLGNFYASLQCTRNS